MKSIIHAVEEFEMKDHWMTQGDRKGRTVLHHAAIYGYMNVVTFIVKDVIESFEEEELRTEFLNVPDYKGRTPLFHAAVEKRGDIVRFLIERGANLESITNEKHIEQGSTVLMACAERNSKECFAILMESGADLLATREDGADATYIAARYGHINIIDQITESRNITSVINRPTFKSRTPLLTAAFHGHLQVCKLLFKNGAEINYQDENKFTALIYAANEGHFDIVKWLIENGADVHVKDNFGDTALMCAELNEHTEIIRILRRLTKIKEEEDQEEEDKIKKQRRKTKGKLSLPAVSQTAKLVVNANNTKRMSR